MRLEVSEIEDRIEELNLLLEEEQEKDIQDEEAIAEIEDELYSLKSELEILFNDSLDITDILDIEDED